MNPAKDKSGDGARDDTAARTFREIAEIRDELSRQGGLQRTLLYAQAGELAKRIIEEFEKDEVLTRTFAMLAVPRSQIELVGEFKKLGVTGASQPTISRKMERLDRELGVIAPVSEGTKFAHSESASALRLFSAVKRHPLLKKWV